MESELDRLRKKVENFPSASLYNRLAELARDAGSVTEAQDICKRCMREFPRNGQAYVILAEIEIERGAKDEGLKLLQAAIERDARSVPAHLMLANLEAGEKDFGKALVHLKHALSLKPNDQHIAARIAQIERDLTGALAKEVAAREAQAASPRSAGAGPAAEPLVPFAGPITTAVKAASSGATARAAALDALCAESGVRGAVVADLHGRVVMAKNLDAGQDELLAALSSEIVQSGLACQNVLGAERLTTWALTAGAGQALAFQRDRSFSVIVLADPSVRPAMLELRARQALIDIGAA